MRALACLAVLLVHATATGQDAVSQDPVAGIVSRIDDALLTADAADSDKAKLESYLDALDRLVYLKALADATPVHQDGTALAALGELSTEGASTDSVRSLILATLYRLIAEDGDDTAWRVEIDRQLTEMESNALRVSGYVQLAMLDADPASGTLALPVLRRAMDFALGIDEVEARTSALGSIALAAAGFEDNTARNLVNQAIGQMWPARARGFARFVIARQKLEIIGGFDLSAQALVMSVDAALSAGNGDLALTLALAIDPDSDEQRTGAINAVLASALDQGDITVFATLATAYVNEEDQRNAVLWLIEDRLASDRLLDVSALIEYLPQGPSRAGMEFSLATALQNAGLTKMAADAFARGTKVIETLNGVQRDAALGQAIESAVAADNLDAALDFFAMVEDTTIVQSALRRLSKGLSDAGNIADAQTVFEALDAPDDQAYALSGIAQAQVKAGNVDVGVAALESISNPADRGRVQAQIVRHYAGDGQLDTAFALALEIADASYGVQAYLYIAEEATEIADTQAASRANEFALALANSVADDSRRWTLIGDVARSMAIAGDLGAANALTDDILDAELRARAIGLLAAQTSSANEAIMELVDSVQTAPGSDAALAKGLIGLSRDPDSLQRVLARVLSFSDDRLRVATFRAIAEEQLKRLDVFDHGLGAGQSLTQFALAAQVPRLSLASSQGARPIYANGQFEALELPKVAGGFGSFGYPALNKGVADLRAELPTPVKGAVSVTLASLSPYNGKFLEDLAGGQTGMQVAANAQGELQPRIIIINSGVYTLGQLADEVVDTGGFALVQRDDDVVTLRAPVIVGEGATLILSGQEASLYNLSATAGAFIATAGTLYILDTTVQSWDETTAAPRLSTKKTSNIFRPYLIGWSGSTMNLGGSIINALGYAAPKSFGLAFSAGPKELLSIRPDVPNPTGTVVDNLFRNFEYGFYSYEADDVYLVGNSYDDNVVYGIDPHDRSHRLVIALNTTYGTQNKHGIIISREVDNSWIVGNVSFDNQGSGIMLDRDSTATLIYGNVAFANGQDGLTLFESSCNLIAGNDFFANGRAGIKIRNSWDVGVYANLINSNAEAGLEAYSARIEGTSESRDFVLDPYMAVASFSMAQNDIAGNGVGLKVSGVSAFSVFGNNFRTQSGPLAAGDAKGLESYLIGSDGGRAIVSQACLPPRPNYACSFRDLGLFANDGQQLGFQPQSGSSCESVAQTAQMPTLSQSVSQ